MKSFHHSLIKNRKIYKFTTQSKLEVQSKMFPKSLFLTIFCVVDVWTYEVYLKGFQSLIADNGSFNSFLIPENKLESAIAQNSSISGCVRLITNETDPDETVLSLICDKLDPKCSNTKNFVSNFWSIAQPNMCKLQGNLSDVSIIVENDTDQDFIHIIIRGCYHISNRTKIRTNYIWTLTNNTYLKYSTDNTVNEDVSMKFVDGSGCDNLCNAIFCTELSGANLPMPTQVTTAGGGFLRSLLIFGILAAVGVIVIGLSYGFFKLYNKV